MSSGSGQERVRRKLAAIMAADVVGFSGMMEQREVETLGVLKRHLEDTIKPLIEAYGGRIFKLVGDGVMSEFASVIDATECAVEFQNQMFRINVAADEYDRMEFRLGIHVGDVIVEGEDVFGDGVNLAARLECMADPGGICISGDVYRQVRSKMDVSFRDLGEIKLKNIIEPIRAYKIDLRDEADECATVEESVARSAPRRAPSDRPSIAVLPFLNAGGDPEQDFFCDGIAEDIITDLSKKRTLLVIARNSSFSYKGDQVKPSQIAEELGVKYLLDGSVRMAGNKARVTARLSEAGTGTQIWAERYDRELQDIFAVQDEITQNIIASILPGIYQTENQKASRKPPESLGVWELIIRAHNYLGGFGQADLAEARKLLNKALSLNSNNSSAYSDLALVHHFEAVFGWSVSPAASHEEFVRSAKRAIELDNENAAAHTVSAISELFSGEHARALERLRRGIALDPNLALAHGYTGIVYAFMGEYEESMVHVDEAIRLSPRDAFLVVWNICKAWASLTDERYADTYRFAELAIETRAEFADGYLLMAASAGHLGERRKAAAALDSLQQRMPSLTLGDARLRRPLKRPEDRERLRAGLEQAGMSA